MNNLETLKYIASYPILYDKSVSQSELLYKAQHEFYSGGLQNGQYISFDPLLWLATHLNELNLSGKLKLLKKDSITPHSVIYDNLPIISNYTVCNSMLANITQIALSMNTTTELSFSSHNYYNLHVLQIERYIELINTDVVLENTTKAHLFYICYGYWNNILLEPPNVLAYICSSGELIEKFNDDEHQGSLHFYNIGYPLTFNPILYVASNFNNVEALKQCVNCKGDINIERVCRHYIKYGYKDRLQVDSFDYWSYLANNHKRIKKLLKKIQKTKNIDYDFVRLTPDLIAQDYIRRKGKCRYDVFNAVQFVKTYVDDKDINEDKKLTIENAAKYFIKYYVLLSKVRYHVSFKYKVVLFLKGRIVDSFKQIPFNATRFIVETRCF